MAAPSPSSPEERLRKAIKAVRGDDLLASLGELARAMPIPLGLETVGIRLRASSGERAFHLVAMEGASPREISFRSLEPFSLVIVRSLFALGPKHSLARWLGQRWVGGRWILDGDETIGVITAGIRTDRRPNEDEDRLFTDVAAELGRGLRSVDRSTKALERMSALLAREAMSNSDSPPSPELSVLRPRERVILALYAEGLSAQEIGRMHFISPHTVRTHVKNAFRRLDIHSREEAARIVHADQVARIV
jgi:DNA-binding CsgD family transcriptional regulator